MTQASIILSGDQEVIARFNRVSDQFKRSQVTRVLSKAGTVVKRAVQSQAPVGPTGKLKRSVRKKTLRGDPPAVSVRPDFKRAPHAHLVVRGTAERFHKRAGVSLGGLTVSLRGKSVGAMPANPFVERGERASKATAFREITQGFKQLLREASL